MSGLPTGTVTFLFTDIEGSTELLTALGEKYGSVLERHNELLRGAIARHSGMEVMTEGDSFFVVFENARSAIAAAVDGQRLLAEGEWPAAASVRVRMGLHTGEAVLGGDNYLGLDVHRAARIASAGHGGQVLVSDTTRSLVADRLPDGVTMRDLGSHRLKGLPAPEPIHQLVVDGLPSEFPPIRSLDARPNNLPSALTSFVGRESEVDEVSRRLAGARLLTLTGPGGTGKTRLALRVAEELVGAYRDGVWFVALDALRDPALVPATIAAALGVKLPADRPPLDALAASLADRVLLLLLDNFEQVTAAADGVAQLLSSAPNLRVLATSRTPLRIYGEQEYPVPPLANTGDMRRAGLAGAETLAQYDAVRLFIERAIAVRPDFSVTNANAPAVAEICARLDGLPLAIELAAARIKLLTPEQMLERLERNLSLLSSTARDLPERQRTLHGAIGWSYDLLTEAERSLFASVSAFRGGFTLDAAEAVCASDDTQVEVLDGLSSLVDGSLLRSLEAGAETRFTMLETIRSYAREKLAEAGRSDAILERHANHYLTLARRVAEDLTSANQVSALNRLVAEQDNLRAAFSRATEHDLIDQALAAGGAMWRFWQLRGDFAEGRAILERLLSQPNSDRHNRAAALTGAGGIAYWQGDFAAMGKYYTEARQIYEELDDRPRLADAVYNESYVHLVKGDSAAAKPSLERSIALFREAGNELGAAEAEVFIAFAYYIDADPRMALELTERSANTYRAAGAKWQLGDALTGLAMIYATVGDWTRGMAALRESIEMFRDVGAELGFAMAFEATAAAAAWVGDADLAARLYGKADELRRQLGGGAPTQVFVSPAFRDMAVQALGAERFEALAAEGAGLTNEATIGLVDTFEPPPDAPPIRRQ